MRGEESGFVAPFPAHMPAARDATNGDCSSFLPGRSRVGIYSAMTSARRAGLPIDRLSATRPYSGLQLKGETAKRRLQRP